MWNNTFKHSPWDDSVAVRNLFLGAEVPGTKVPTNLSYEKWDCTALFQATIYAQSFALPDSTGRHKTLSELHLTPPKLAHGSFHVSVVSPGGDEAETFALAIDQLRLLRNTLCHSTSSEIDKKKFDQYVQLSRDAFEALRVKTDPIDDIGSLIESHFPTDEVRKLKQGMKEMTREYINFLERVITEKSSEIHELKMLLEELKGKVDRNASKQEITEILELKLNELKSALGLDTPGKYSLVIQLCNRRKLNSRLSVWVKVPAHAL